MNSEEQEVSYWGAEIDNFALDYSPRDDTFIFTPIDMDGDRYEAAAVAINAKDASFLIGSLKEGVDKLNQVRRLRRKAKKKNLDLDRIDKKLEDQFVASGVILQLEKEFRKKLEKEGDRND